MINLNKEGNINLTSGEWYEFVVVDKSTKENGETLEFNGNSVPVVDFFDAKLKSKLNSCYVNPYSEKLVATRINGVLNKEELTLSNFCIVKFEKGIFKYILPLDLNEIPSSRYNITRALICECDDKQLVTIDSIDDENNFKKDLTSVIIYNGEMGFVTTDFISDYNIYLEYLSEDQYIKIINKIFSNLCYRHIFNTPSKLVNKKFVDIIPKLSMETRDAIKKDISKLKRKEFYNSIFDISDNFIDVCKVVEMEDEYIEYLEMIKTLSRLSVFLVNEKDLNIIMDKIKVPYLNNKYLLRNSKDILTQLSIYTHGKKYRKPLEIFIKVLGKKNIKLLFDSITDPRYNFKHRLPNFTNYTANNNLAYLLKSAKELNCREIITSEIYKIYFGRGMSKLEKKAVKNHIFNIGLIEYATILSAYDKPEDFIKDKKWHKYVLRPYMNSTKNFKRMLKVDIYGSFNNKTVLPSILPEISKEFIKLLYEIAEEKGYSKAQYKALNRNLYGHFKNLTNALYSQINPKEINRRANKPRQFYTNCKNDKYIKAFLDEILGDVAKTNKKLAQMKVNDIL